jgi:hypothetical protein
VKGARDREQLFRELRQHLGIPDHGGRAALTVVVDGLELTVEVTAEMRLTSARHTELLKQVVAFLEKDPTWIRAGATCGLDTGKKKHGFRHRCAARIAGALVYSEGDKVRPLLRCTSHGTTTDRACLGFVRIPPRELKRLEKLADEDRVRRYKEEDARRLREGLDLATGAPL